jgi:hypothetical protein
MKGRPTMSQPTSKPSMNRLLSLLSTADQPFDEEAVAMDCQDGCEEIAQIAERVANGEHIDTVLPNFAAHMNQIKCCKEEFEALVSVLEAEDKLLAEIEAQLEQDADNDQNENE